MSQLTGTQRCQPKLVDDAELEDAINEGVAVLLLTQVDFRSGRLFDMAKLTRLAQDKGALVIWDLAHSAGALPVALDEYAALTGHALALRAVASGTAQIREVPRD